MVTSTALTSNLQKHLIVGDFNGDLHSIDLQSKKTQKKHLIVGDFNDNLHSIDLNLKNTWVGDYKSHSPAWGASDWLQRWWDTGLADR